MSLCLSVHPSHAGIESKWLYVFSKFFYIQVAPPVYSRTKRDDDIPMGTPLTGTLNAKGVQKIKIFYQYLALSGK